MARRFMLALPLLLSGRAMTVPFIHTAGRGLQGDPPAAWLMPLIGDAVIGVSALWIAWLLSRRSGLWVWVSVIAWNVVAIWDALAAWIVQTTAPWPEFFMLRAVGTPMFLAASLMHATIIVLAARPEVRASLIGAPRTHAATAAS